MYVKIHMKTDQGIKNISQEEGDRLAGENPFYHTADLFNAIEEGNYPSWTMYLQVMTPQQAEKYRWNIFDMTKVWPHKDFPLQPVGKLTLNRNVCPFPPFPPSDACAFQVLGRGLTGDSQPTTSSTSSRRPSPPRPWSPALPRPPIPVRAPQLLSIKTVDFPDTSPLPLKVLQARMFAYADAARYRLGVNYQQLPCNRPVSAVYSPYQRDGAARYDTNYGGDPNYVRSQLRPVNFKGKVGASGYAPGGHEEWVGQVAGYTSEVTDEDFVQAREMWKVLGRSHEQADFVHNLAGHLGSAIPQMQADAISKFSPSGGLVVLRW